MGTLLDLIRRFFGPRDQAVPQPGPTRPVVPPPEPAREPGPVAVSLPPTSIEPRPEPGVSVPVADSPPVDLVDPAPPLTTPEPEPEPAAEPQLVASGAEAELAAADLVLIPEPEPAAEVRGRAAAPARVAGGPASRRCSGSAPTKRAGLDDVRTRTQPARATPEAIAHRRATDILYLGRGVSEALNDRRGDPEALDRAGLPRLDTPADLADRLGIAVGRLRWLAFHAEVAARVHYVRFEVPKKGGGTRHLSAPHRSLALAQRWIFTEILAGLPTEDPAHGFVPGRGIVTNARLHAGQAVVVNLDLADFFPSCWLPPRPRGLRAARLFPPRSPRSSASSALRHPGG